MHLKSFPGKILLFGEYSVLNGSDAAVIPYRDVHAELTFSGNNRQAGNLLSPQFCKYLENDDLCRELVDTARLQDDISNGMFISSTIPVNKGLGSSGAVCACIFEHYKRKEILVIAELRNVLSRMESWFHGNSSGIDPLCIYLNKPLIKTSGDYWVPDISKLQANDFGAFLIDTGIMSETLPLVTFFRKQMEDTKYATGFVRNYVPLVNSCVSQWKQGQLSASSLFKLSKLQISFFSKMIPEKYQVVWETGIKNHKYALKLCGSGGGGMILGFTENTDQTLGFLKEKYGINAIAVDSGEKAVIPD